MNAVLFKHWFEEVWYNVNEDKRKNCCFLLDSCGSIHTSYKPYDGTKVFFFPPNTTSRLQPMDLGVNKPFKDRIRKSWELWMSLDEHMNDYTKKGYRRQVDRQTFIDWVEQAWDDINEDTIKNSFNVLIRGLKEVEDLMELV